MDFCVLQLPSPPHRGQKIPNTPRDFFWEKQHLTVTVSLQFHKCFGFWPNRNSQEGTIIELPPQTKKKQWFFLPVAQIPKKKLQQSSTNPSKRSSRKPPTALHLYIKETSQNPHMKPFLLYSRFSGKWVPPLVILLMVQKSGDHQWIW